MCVCVCVCICLDYPACKSHPFGNIMFQSPTLSLDSMAVPYRIPCDYLKKDMAFEKKIPQMRSWIFSTAYFNLKKSSARYYKFTQFFM